ncbi:MAG: Asp-tRNA(Asn)/Glu-tRNA(Gln) amidotransferase subunit GatC [Patescibacteria group bacterium]
MSSQSISEETVKKIAALARLDLTPDGVRTAAGDLGKILDYVDRLSSVKTGGIEPFHSGERPLTALREDRSDYFKDREGLLPKPYFEDDLLVTKGVFTKENP